MGERTWLSNTRLKRDSLSASDRTGVFSAAWISPFLVAIFARDVIILACPSKKTGQRRAKFFSGLPPSSVKQGRNRQFRVILCELLPTFQGTCMQESTAKISSWKSPIVFVPSPRSGRPLAQRDRRANGRLQRAAPR